MTNLSAVYAGITMGYATGDRMTSSSIGYAVTGLPVAKFPALSKVIIHTVRVSVLLRVYSFAGRRQAKFLRPPMRSVLLKIDHESRRLPFHGRLASHADEQNRW